VRHLPVRAGDLRRSVARVTEATRNLGFDAQVSLTDGLATTVEWTLGDDPGGR
jgi:nucleoside-diphosphate-sugar epimerase